MGIASSYSLALTYIVLKTHIAFQEVDYDDEQRSGKPAI